MAIQKKNPEIVYDARSNFGLKGWWIIILIALTMLVFCTVQSLSMNVVVAAKAAEIGVESGRLLAINTPAGIIGLFAALGISKLAQRFGLKKIHVISLLLGVVVVAMWAISKTVTAYAIPVVLMFCLMSSTEINCGKMLANWFPKKKGIATGWATMGLNAAGIFMVGIMMAILNATGSSRAVLFFLAGLLAFIAILTIVGYKNYPEQWGAYPDNIPTEKLSKVEDIRTGWTAKSILAQKELWISAIAMGLFAMTTFGYVSSVVPAMMIKGFSPGTAVLMMSITSVFGFLGSYFFGYIDQKFGVQKAAIILGLALIIAIVFFFVMSNTGAWVYIILMGLCIGATNNYPISITAQIFGRAGFQKAYPLHCAIKGVIQFTVYAIQSWSLLTTGDYGRAWMVMIGLVVVSIVLLYFCNMNPKKDPIEETISAGAVH